MLANRLIIVMVVLAGTCLRVRERRRRRAAAAETAPVYLSVRGPAHQHGSPLGRRPELIEESWACESLGRWERARCV